MHAVALILAVVAGGELAASAEARYVVAEHRLFAIKPDLRLPEGQTALLTTWTVPDGLDYRQRDGELIGTGQPGEYTIKMAVVSAKTEGDVIKLPVRQHFWQATLVIEGKGPRPPPKPDDDDPPSPTSAPFPSPRGLGFIVVYEASDTASLPVDQRAIFSSSKVLQFGNQHAARIDGDAFFRILDDDYSADDLTNLPPHVRTAYTATKAAAKQLPWIAIANGERGYSGPLPATVDATLELLGRFK